MAYIDLNRSFVSIPKDREFDDGYDSYLFRRSQTTWKDILELNRVVILAEAGSGKTEEITATAKRLRVEGKRAFFFRLELLSGDFDKSFEEGSPEEFKDWLLSYDEAWFFLDSVDEVRLQGPVQFEQAIRNFAAHLRDNKQRARIIITSRPSAWRAKSDLGFISKHLPFYETQKQQEEDSIDEFSSNEKDAYSAGFTHAEGGESPIEPSIYGLQSFDNEQVRAFANACGVTDVTSFLQAIERAEADIFSDTPQDLIELIKYWNKFRKISNRAEMIEFSIGEQLDEKGDRAESLPLSKADALSGAMLLAASATFTKKNQIFIPDGNEYDRNIQSESIEAKAALQNWDDKKCQSLLLKSVFDPGIYGTVRFHHRSVREHLTARWLYSFLQSGKSRRGIESLFFAERHGEWVTVPSMRPILAWLVLWDEHIRQRTIDISPEVLIQGGDPSALPLEVRANFLKEFCNHCANQPSRHLSFDLSEVRRFSHPDMGRVINELIHAYSDNDDIAELLLRMIWQGDVADCSAVALDNATNSQASTYRRIAAIRSIVSIGSGEQKEELVSSILAEIDLDNESVLDEIILGFAPEYLNIEGVIALMGRIKNRSRYSSSSLFYYLEQFIQNNCAPNDLSDFVRGVLPLLKQSPVIEKRFFELSQDYQWALPVAAVAAERLVKEGGEDALRSETLEIISLAQASRSFDTYKPAHLDLDKLVSGNPELNLALFWFDVELSRKYLDKKKAERVTDWFQVISLDHFWQFDSDDFDKVVEDVRSKEFLDDRLVALSLAFNIYRHANRTSYWNFAKWCSAKWRDVQWRYEMRQASRGNQELEAKFKSLLKSLVMNKEQREWQRQEASWKLKQKERERKEKEDRIKAVVSIKKQVDILRDTSIAAEGSVWNASHYLLDVIREKVSDRGHWAHPHWQVLISEFGQEAAEAFRDGCIGYWREYVPEVRSEGIDNLNSTPVAVSIALSGIEMEAGLSADWPNELSKKEADLVSRYAVKELNGFPDWLQRFHAFFPNALENRLLKEIEWELAEYEGEQPCHYVLSDVSRLEWLRPKLAGRVFEMLQVHEPQYLQSVEDALNIILSSDSLDESGFVELAKIKVDSLKEVSRIGLWFAAWTSVQAEQGIDTLSEKLSAMDDREQATLLAMHFITALLGSRRVTPVGSAYKSYRTVKYLYRLILLMNEYIHHSDDIDRANTGGYSPTLRDNAQDARNHLFQLLKEIPGKETYMAMLDLVRTHPDEQSREWYRVHATQRAEADAEQDSWTVADVVTFAAEAEKTPRNHRELFDLAVSRLNDLKDNLEGADSSNASLVARSKDEREHRNYIGGWLRDHSHGLYSMAPEEEMADAKKPDLRFHQQTIDAPVPVELKVADNWTPNKLLERLENQLCGQYLRDARSNCGVFLLTYCGTKDWKHPETRKSIGFSELLEIL